MSGRDYLAIAKKYAENVRDGKVAACRYVRLACERHLEGLKRQRDKSYPYKLDRKAATKVCAYVELLPHVKGDWARKRELIHLEPWQCFILVNVFGWLRKRDNLRRYRRVYVEVPRKNAKSTLTAAVGDYMLTADDEHGAEVYSGATTEKQAWEVFGPARLMVKNTPDLVEAFGVQVGAKNLHVLETASKFEPIIGKPGDGASPSMSITDEYHEHQTSEQYDTMVTGMGARRHPIAWVITTAGSNSAGPCYNLRQQAVDALEGTIENDEMFVLIFTIDEQQTDANGNIIKEGDDWTDPAVLAKANPNMGVSVYEEFLQTEQRNAINNPREQSKFKTKHLNVWVTAASPYFNKELWDRLGDPKLTEAAFAGQPCVLGLDLASKLDIAAKMKVFHRDIEGIRHYYALGRFYVPEPRTKEAERRHYEAWVKKGYLVATKSEITDYDCIETDIKADAEKNTVLQLGSDPYNATQLLTHCQKHIGQDKVIEVPQTVAHLSEPMKEIQALIVSGRIHHDGNPAMSWMIGNVTAQADRNENVFPRKEGPERKIDGAVALIIAMGRALVAFEKLGSIYDTQPVEVYG